MLVLVVKRVTKAGAAVSGEDIRMWNPIGCVFKKILNQNVQAY